MKVWAPIFNLVTALLLILLGASYINICEVIERDFDQARYDYAVRQSTEAMFRSTLRAEDIGLDYRDMSYVSIDSSEALEIFDRVMCANYNMAPSDANFSAINDGIAACAIAGYDGYYLLESSDSDSIDNNGSARDGYALKFSTKKPYLIANDRMMYAVDTYKKTYSGMSLTEHNADPILYTTGAALPSGITEDSLQTEINKQIRSAILNEAANSNNVELGSLEGFRLLFPDETTVTGVNPFEVPGIFIIMDGVKYASTDTLSSMAVSGYKVVKKVNVIAFTDISTGRSYYCYEGQLRDEEKTAASGGIALGGSYGNFEIENYYGSIREACQEVSPTTGLHYAPYYDIMARKITK